MLILHEQRTCIQFYEINVAQESLIYIVTQKRLQSANIHFINEHQQKYFRENVYWKVKTKEKCLLTDMHNTSFRGRKG